MLIVTVPVLTFHMAYSMDLVSLVSIAETLRFDLYIMAKPPPFLTFLLCVRICIYFWIFHYILARLYHFPWAMSQSLCKCLFSSLLDDLVVLCLYFSGIACLPGSMQSQDGSCLVNTLVCFKCHRLLILTLLVPCLLQCKPCWWDPHFLLFCILRLLMVLEVVGAVSSKLY